MPNKISLVLKKQIDISLYQNEVKKKVDIIIDNLQDIEFLNITERITLQSLLESFLLNLISSNINDEIVLHVDLDKLGENIFTSLNANTKVLSSVSENIAMSLTDMDNIIRTQGNIKLLPTQAINLSPSLILFNQDISLTSFCTLSNNLITNYLLKSFVEISNIIDYSFNSLNNILFYCKLQEVFFQQISLLPNITEITSNIMETLVKYKYLPELSALNLSNTQTLETLFYIES